MANEKHLKTLRQGVEVWNRWRKDNPKVTPSLNNADLSGVTLRGADLSRANLNGATLNKTDFSEANLRGAVLSETDLSGADLHEADLSRANLNGANLLGANLCETTFRGAYLRGAYLIRADLSGKDLREANFREANLSGANLSGANLSGANLSGANILGANLLGANLSEIDLSGKDFSGANLTKQDLTGANLSRAILINVSFETARLINAKLDGANLTGARLWETQRAGWSIKDVICEYVFWDEKAEKKSIYAEGEFEKLFADLTKIQLSYKGGMSLLEVATLPSLIQHLANTFPNSSLRFISMHTDSGGAVVELAIEDIDDLSKEQIKQLQSALKKEAQQQVEYQRKALAEREKRLELEGEVKQLSIVVDKLIQRPNFAIQSIEDFKMSDDKGSKYINKGQVGAMGDNAHADHMTFNQTVNNTSESLDLVALASELAQLRIAIASMQDSSPKAVIAAGEIAKAEIAASEKDESGVWQHMKAAGKYALDTATTIGTTLAAEVLKKSMGM